MDLGIKWLVASWKPTVRHLGAYVAPRHYNPVRIRHHQRKSEGLPQGVLMAHQFGLVVPPINNSHLSKNGEVLNVQQGASLNNALSDCTLQDGPTVTARAMLACPITHLTLRMYVHASHQANVRLKSNRSRTDWSNWTEDPSSADVSHHLTLDPALRFDPALRSSARLPPDRMLTLAAFRRAGQHPTYHNDAWGAAICTLRDLKEFKLVLETFPVKKSQLDTVVECARTWKFPLQDTQWEVAFHDVESIDWTTASEDQDDQSPKRRRGRAPKQVKCYSRSCDEGVPHSHPPFLDDEITSENVRLGGELQKKPWMWDSIGAEVRIIRFRRRKAE